MVSEARPLSEKDWDHRQRVAFTEIAKRRQQELCASYTLVAIGLQSSYAIDNLNIKHTTTNTTNTTNTVL
jgi:hypothetical protein